MATEISCEWKGDMAFEAEVNGHKIMIDADAEVGGHDKGPRPKPLLLVSLAGCTGMDVASILQKMHVQYDALNVDVSAEMTDKHPKHYNKIHITYRVKGKDLPAKKVNRAVELSQEIYCGVSEMLRKAAELSYEIIMEE